MSVLDLRCRIAVRPHFRRIRRVILYPCHAEIAELIIPEFRDQNVLRLDIAVNDMPCLAEHQRLADVLTKPDDL